MKTRKENLYFVEWLQFSEDVGGLKKKHIAASNTSDILDYLVCLPDFLYVRRIELIEKDILIVN